ncbi:MAG: hypothetical protein LBQ28_02100 [Prevotellaceae bacterium]|jgi:hypothetical protein|nr:hypothetical protein [Prevotellaceae bacterium]
MKNNYLDLTLLEFLDAITSTKQIYHVEITPAFCSDDESDTIEGDKWALIETLQAMLQNISKGTDKNTRTTIENLNRTIKEIRNHDEYTFDELSEIEIYNYLNTITCGFDIERVKVVLKDIECYYELNFLERINRESKEQYKANKWEIPQKKLIIPTDWKNPRQKQGKEVIIPDYEKMRNKTHIAAGYSISRAMNMLKKKISSQANHNISTHHFVRSFTDKQRKALLTSLTAGKFLPDDTNKHHFNYVFGGIPVPNEKPFEPLKWEKKTTLLAYFVDKLFTKSNPDNLWDIAENMFDKKNLRQSKNNYLGNKKTNGKPSGYETIDEILQKAGLTQ